MTHDWRTGDETDTDVVFECAVCKARCGFNKPGIGEPAAVKVADGWAPHPEIDQYVSPCEKPA